MTALEMTLHYSLGEGWLAPWVSALREGIALGRQCDDCRRVSFMPLRVCPCGSSDGAWVELSGHAEIRWRTIGADGDFALARFAGADTDCVVAVRDMMQSDRRGRLIPALGPAPQIVLGPVAGEAT